jgi:hypothetical protein
MAKPRKRKPKKRLSKTEKIVKKKKPVAKKKKPVAKKKKPVAEKKKPKKKPKKPKKKPRKKKVELAPKEPPEEFEIIELPDDIESALEKIRKVFEDARAIVEFETPIPIIHPYLPVPEKNYLGEVDGEWRVDVMRGETSSDMLQAMQEAMDWPILGLGYWITVGVRFHGKSEYDEDTGTWTFVDEEELHYNRDQGMLDVGSNYRPMIRKARTISAFNAILEGSSKNPTPMWESIEKKYHRKISQIYVRINWNPQNIQPKRKE